MTADNAYRRDRDARRLRVVSGGLLIGTPDVVSLPGETTVATALQMMLAQRISQTPVVESDGTVQGLFTLVAVIRALVQDFAANPGQLLSSWIEDFLEPATFVGVDDPPDRLLSRLLSLSGSGGEALLFGGSSELVGIVTWEDLLAYYADASQPFLLIEHIEKTVREIIRSRFAADELVSAISEALPATTDWKPGTLEECTFDQYRLVLVCKRHRERFRQVLGPGTGRVQQHLTAVRDIRNKVVHFRDRANAGDLDRLGQARAFLDVKLQRAQSLALGHAG